MIDLLVVGANLYTLRDYGHPRKKEELKDLGFIENGGIAVENGIIVDVDRSDVLKEKYKAKEVIDVEGRAVLPGFVDPHTHAVFAGTRENEFLMRLEGKSYLEILEAGGGILSTLKKVRESSIDDLIKGLQKRVELFFEWGTTTFEAKSGYGLNFEAEIKQLEAIKRVNETTTAEIVSTFIGAHAIPEEFKGNTDGYVDEVINKMLPYVAQNNLAEFVDVFCEKGVFDVEQSYRILRAAIELGLKAKIHADEIEAIGCSELAFRLPMVSCDHLLKITDKGIEAMKQAGAIATLLPGTAFSLKEPFADARRIIEASIPVAIATDCNPGSSYTESMPAIITLAVLGMDMMPQEAIAAATINAAYAIGRADRVGSIDVSKQADFIVLNESSYLFIPYHYGVNPVFKTFKKGRLTKHASAAAD
ncbi:imidazolonepropionase [Hippea jasoniae]|uniref:imidazolonepropionase n=1 Tax=Hippea jasoniae TaxID=944479 RepID=UPI00054D92A2|nr:imidazolonepropionase [Hippea jasoniae]